MSKHLGRGMRSAFQVFHQSHAGADITVQSHQLGASGTRAVCSYAPPFVHEAGRTGCKHRVRARASHCLQPGCALQTTPAGQESKRTSGGVQGRSHPRPGRSTSVKGCWAPGPGPPARFGAGEPSWYLSTLGGWRQSATKMTLLWRSPAVPALGAMKAKPLSIGTRRPGSQTTRTRPTWRGLRGREFGHYGAFRKSMCLPISVLLIT